ncbi:MAG TPA: PAS domain S-box protein [Bryobacteraceae bacterium]|nr:PAS domain S-box protein [Bryobacteraceae bacterium]
MVDDRGPGIKMNATGIDASKSAIRSSVVRARLADLKGYGLAMLSVGVAIGLALLLQQLQFRDSAVPLLALACTLASWYGGPGPALLAVLLSSLLLPYFFLPPLYSLAFKVSDLPYFLVFISFACLLSWFATIRRRAEEDLRETRDKLQLEVAERTEQARLLQLTHDAILVCDMDSIITYWNPGAEELYGWTQKEALGRSSEELMRTRFPQAVEEIRAELLETNRWEGELVRTNADGVQVIVSSRWSLRRDQEDRPVAILETSNDVTTRKRWEQEVQSFDKLARQVRLLDQTHDSIVFRNVDGLITYWNRGAQELYGWSAEEAIGRRSHELLQTIFPVPLEEIDDELLRTGVWEGELRHTRANGAKVVVASRWSVARDERGQPIVMETNNDITERKRREEEIRALNEELAKRSSALEASNKELEAFAYSISHDLRAPLRHLAGFAELLRKSAASSLNEKGVHYVTMILESAARMGSLIDDLLAFSRISRAEAHNSVVNLEQLVQEAVAEVRQDTKERDIFWKINPLPACYGDRSMLRLALVNLISNAVKFTRTRPQAEIEIGCIEDARDEVVLFVRDNGVGFDMKYANKLFGVFQRLHAQEPFEGTGIGLATVQHIVHRHGGRTWAEGVVDGGATFYFSLSRITGG